MDDEGMGRNAGGGEGCRKEGVEEGCMSERGGMQKGGEGAGRWGWGVGGRWTDAGAREMV